MQSSPLPAARILDPAEGQYTAAEVASIIAGEIDLTAAGLAWDFQTLAAATDLNPPVRAVAEELLGAIAHTQALARQLQTIAS